MSVSARDALEYATRDAFLKLYAVLAGGVVTSLIGQFVAATALNALEFLAGTLVSLAGLLGVLTAVVAIFHKVLAES